MSLDMAPQHRLNGPQFKKATCLQALIDDLRNLRIGIHANSNLPLKQALV